jgi:hypothetical protein
MYLNSRPKYKDATNHEGSISLTSSILEPAGNNDSKEVHFKIKPLKTPAVKHHPQPSAT